MTDPKKIKSTVLLLLIFAFPLVSFTQIQWKTNGIKAASADVGLVNLKAVSDDSGGVFFVFEDDRSGDIDIFVQYINHKGSLEWGLNGTIACGAGGDQKNPSITTDGYGGIFIAWQDNILEKIYAQHIDKNGALLWSTFGIAVCSEDCPQLEVKITSDGNKGVILVWRDKRNGSSSDIFAQRLDAEGNCLWTSSGTAVTEASGIQSNHIIIGDNQGKIFVVWVDRRNSNIDIYAQKLSASGIPEWTTDGIAITANSANQYTVSVDTSAGSYIVAWTDERNGNSDIFAQRIGSDGSIKWDTDGKAVCQVSGIQDKSRITQNISGSTIITWYDTRSGGYDIYAQHIDSLGNPSWTSDGIAVNDYSGLQYYPEIISDNSGGAFVIWNDTRNSDTDLSDTDLYSQHLNIDGTLLWNSDGLPVAAADSQQYQIIVISDNSGGFITLWQDKRDGKSDIYAQLINDNISFNSPSSDSVWAGDAPHQIQWSAASPFIFDHLSITASAVNGDGYPYTISAELPPSQITCSWTPESINSTDVIIKIQGMDNRDSVICQYYSDKFTIDSNQPHQFSLLSPEDDATVEMISDFIWESTTDDLTGLDHYELWIDDALMQDDIQDTSYSLTDIQKLSMGVHTWTVRAVDRAGLYYQPPLYTLTTVEDNTPPAAFSLSSPEDKFWTNLSDPLFTWQNSSDAGKGLKEYRFYLDGDLIVDNILPSQTHLKEPILTPGEHTWYITAVDSANNSTKSTESWTIYMDNQPPSPFSLLQPQSNIWLNDSTPLFSWQVTSDTSTGIGLAEYELWIDDNCTVDDIPGETSQIQLQSDNSLSEGSHVWYIKAKDSLGNNRNSRSEFFVNIDISSPAAFDLISPENNSYITTVNPEFSWNAGSDNISGIMEYRLLIDNILNKDNITDLTVHPESPLTEGTHTWKTAAVDSAENFIYTNSFTFIADTTRPSYFELLYPSYNDTLFTNRPVFSWEPANDILSGFDKFQLFLNGELIADNLSSSDTVFSFQQEIENRSHNWKVKAFDNAGNVRISENFLFTVRCNAPEITSSATAQAEEDLFFSYTAQAEDPDGQEIEISFSDYASWLSTSENTISGTPEEGTQDTSFLVIATDGYNYDSLLVIVDVEAVNDPPVITSSNNASAVEDELFTYTGQAEDPENDLLQYIYFDYPEWLSPSDSIISGIPGENNSDTSFVLIVTDGYLSDTLKISLEVTPVNDPPVIISSASVSVYEDSTLLYIIIAEDPDNSNLTYSFHEYPSWLTPSDNSITGVTDEGTVDTSFIAVVSDHLLSDSLKVTINVIPINDPPTITSSDTAYAEEDKLFIYQAEASDPDSKNLTFSYADYPVWLTPGSEAKISGTPTEGRIDTSFKVIASDSETADTLTVTLLVQPVNDPPFITSPDTAYAEEHKLFIYQAEAEDVDSKNLSIYFLDYPSWLSPSGSKISGTPVNNCQDTTFKVIVSDTELSDTLIVTLLINNINDYPVFIHPLPRNVTLYCTDTLTLYLDDFVTDPEDPDSSLFWCYAVLDTNNITVNIDKKTHKASISGKNTEGKIRIKFTVFDTEGGSAADTLHMTIIFTCINDQHITEIPDSFILENVYPNPFNNCTTIKFGLPKETNIFVNIYNIIGQKVAELITDKKMSAGFHEIQWNADALPSGIYLYQIRADGWVSIKRMVLMR